VPDNSERLQAFEDGGVCTVWTHASKKILLTAPAHLIDSARVEVTQLGGVYEQVDGSSTSGPSGSDQRDGSKGFNDPQHAGEHDWTDAAVTLVGS
jgi:hypothetical protein